jgi:hypothetical protein
MGFDVEKWENQKKFRFEMAMTLDDIREAVDYFDSVAEPQPFMVRMFADLLNKRLEVSG